MNLIQLPRPLAEHPKEPHQVHANFAAILDGMLSSNCLENAALGCDIIRWVAIRRHQVNKNPREVGPAMGTCGGSFDPLGDHVWHFAGPSDLNWRNIALPSKLYGGEVPIGEP